MSTIRFCRRPLLPPRRLAACHRPRPPAYQQKTQPHLARWSAWATDARSVTTRGARCLCPAGSLLSLETAQSDQTGQDASTVHLERREGDRRGQIRQGSRGKLTRPTDQQADRVRGGLPAVPLHRAGRCARGRRRAGIAQLVEHRTENPGVPSSNLGPGTKNQGDAAAVAFSRGLASASALWGESPVRSEGGRCAGEAVGDDYLSPLHEATPAGRASSLAEPIG